MRWVRERKSVGVERKMAWGEGGKERLTSGVNGNGQDWPLIDGWKRAGCVVFCRREVPIGTDLLWKDAATGAMLSGDAGQYMLVHVDIGRCWSVHVGTPYTSI